MWEYKVERISCSVFGNNAQNAEKELNILGAQGWEVVAMAVFAENIYFYTLKRLKK